MPLLVRVAREVCEDFGGDPTDVDAQILTHFLDALRNRIDLDRDDPYSKLRDATQRAGRGCARLCQHPRVISPSAGSPTTPTELSHRPGHHGPAATARVRGE
jgi:hypothetical protein